MKWRFLIQDLTALPDLPPALAGPFRSDPLRIPVYTTLAALARTKGEPQ
jgi:hypothetical protein